MTIGPAARNDPAYIQLIARAVAELQQQLTAIMTRATASYLANTPGEVILANATSGALTVSLPKADGFYGKSVQVKKIDSSANAVTIQAKTGETIDGTNTKVIATQYMSYTVMSTGTEWVIV
jgi:hypothetical protein